MTAAHTPTISICLSAYNMAKNVGLVSPWQNGRWDGQIRIRDLLSITDSD